MLENASYKMNLGLLECRSVEFCNLIDREMVGVVRLLMCMSHRLGCADHVERIPDDRKTENHDPIAAPPRQSDEVVDCVKEYWSIGLKGLKIGNQGLGTGGGGGQIPFF